MSSNEMSLKYTEGMASEQEIYSHLMKCNKNFIPPLDKKVNIHEYSNKIFQKAVTFEAWSADTLVGLVAAYFNDPMGQTGYITCVSTIKAYMGQGIASILINLCIYYARQHHFKSICLEVDKSNDHAITLYKKFQFHEYENKDESVLMRLNIKEWGK